MRKLLGIGFPAVAASVMVSITAQAAPVVTGATGTFADGQTVTITGSSFGSGPNVVLFDDFESGNAAAGQVIPLTSPRVGAWSQYGQSTGRPRYTSYANSGTHAWRISDPAFDPNVDNGNRMGQFLQIFSSAIKEIYISYQAAVPPGTTFPGASTTETFPDPSSWKFTWVYDGASGFGGDGKADMCLPTHVGNGNIWFAGNDGNLTTLGNTWWSWKGFNRLSIWLRANASNPTANGDIMFQAVNAEKGMKQINWQDRSVFPSGSSTQWTRLTVPGWWGNGNNTNNKATYDDVYVAVGPNAAARIEIGDAPTYSASRKLTILTPSSWSGTQISATVRAGAFSSLSGAYLYVIDSNNNVSPAFPIGGTPSSVPMAPSDVQAD